MSGLVESIGLLVLSLLETLLLGELLREMTSKELLWQAMV